MNHEKLKIVILGGGTAGWMTANLMAARWKDRNIHFTLIESPDVGIVGVGEGSTPSMQNFFHEIGVEESEWMPECNATYKNGITFEGWTSIPGFEKYCHPFPSQMDIHTFPKFDNNCQLRRHNFDVEAHPDRFFLGSYLSQNQRSPKANHNFPFDHPNGYHFDSNLLGSFLRKKAKQRGVEHLQRHVSGVIQKENGDISSLKFREGEIIEADFFVDCTGFAGLLLQKTLKVPFINLDKVLFNDTAVVVATPVNKDDLNSQTKSTALKYGWAWDIPLTNRTGNGYVFSSRYCSVNDAETEFRTHLGLLDADVNVRTVKWKQGRLEKSWSKNCLAIGLSQGFIEPIEAMALHLVYNSIGHFITEFESGNFSNQNQQQYNSINDRAFDGVVDYILAHYRMNSRRDTDYWRDNAENQNITPSFLAIVQSWLGASQNNLADEIKKYDTGSFFPLASWQILFAGYGVFPPPENVKPQNIGNQSVNMDELDNFIQRCGSNYSSHLESLNTLKQLAK
ncbi:tryptophan halogenase family protein [Paraglaciecola arctica]|uniref:Tryptophan halogenase, putative n=1 Tax=Paraglaciecola arctica BSs20135 TaxID=493475 RepID=K6XK41_9ALTE|nr:tryptophan halogenase family protein [Paraglaciecola arctica]GAC21029.1 tryptophan halogenase, putative [Paraglaciecola arctica BSs20135]